MYIESYGGIFRPDDDCHSRWANRPHSLILTQPRDSRRGMSVIRCGTRAAAIQISEDGTELLGERNDLAL